MINFLTIDVEDYYQVSAFEKNVGPHNWNNYPSRVEENTKNILYILDKFNVKATFFILGWTAQKHPSLVKTINENGHEIGCHSYYHRLIYQLTPKEFYEDTRTAKDVLEQITGNKVKGYRAPSYSITNKSLWAFDILEELGFEFDSSVFPILHDRYGISNAPRFKYKLPKHDIVEFPISTSLLLGQKIPVAGGGYFRLFPFWFTKKALRKINKTERQPFIFYLHPWEIDPEQPRFNQASLLSRFRHYNNLHKTTERFHHLLKEFSFGPICIEQS